MALLAGALSLAALDRDRAVATPVIETEPLAQSQAILAEAAARVREAEAVAGFEEKYRGLPVDRQVA
ncbi:MAG: hypothetical protein QOD41_426 [Cryptosporangiaceae bacterium]|nr:hypothetical protein [Cryptosporangiaceae bacterium]